MKKLTSLQLLMLIGLSISSTKINCENDLQNETMQEQAVELSIQSEETEKLNDEILKNLAEMSPDTINQLLVEEDEIEVNLSAIKKFVDKKNKEIEMLLEQKEVDQMKIAKIAAQLADAQAKLEKAIAIERAKNKKPDRFEQVIKDKLKKAEQSIKKLSFNYYKNKQDQMKSINNTKNALINGDFSQAGKHYVKSVKKGWSNPFRTPDKQ